METKEHILNECEGIHTDETTKVTNEELFEQYGTNTRETANKIIKIQDKMEIHIERPTRKKYTAQKYPCTTCKAPCRSNQSAIECTTCEKWTHLKCTQLSQTEFHQHTLNEQNEWHCTKCKTIMKAKDGTIKLRIHRDDNTQWQCQPTTTIRILRNNQGEWNIT